MLRQQLYNISNYIKFNIIVIIAIIIVAINTPFALFSCLFFMLPFTAFAHDGSEHYGPHMMWQGYGMMMGPFMMILFIAVIIVVGVLIYKWLSGQSFGQASSSEEDPTEILKTRFAKGEIDKEEFEERLQMLQNSK